MLLNGTVNTRILAACAGPGAARGGSVRRGCRAGPGAPPPAGGGEGREVDYGFVGDVVSVAPGCPDPARRGHGTGRVPALGRGRRHALEHQRRHGRVGACCGSAGGEADPDDRRHGRPGAAGRSRLARLLHRSRRTAPAARPGGSEQGCCRRRAPSSPRCAAGYGGCTSSGQTPDGLLAEAFTNEGVGTMVVEDIGTSHPPSRPQAIWQEPFRDPAGARDPRPAPGDRRHPVGLGDEAELAGFLEERLRQRGARRSGWGTACWRSVGRVRCSSSTPISTPFLRCPAGRAIPGGRVGGRPRDRFGSNDAKASVAAMVAAFLAFQDVDLPFTLALALVEGEETKGIGTQAVLRELRTRAPDRGGGGGRAHRARRGRRAEGLDGPGAGGEGRGLPRRARRGSWCCQRRGFWPATWSRWRGSTWARSSPPGADHPGAHAGQGGHGAQRGAGRGHGHPRRAHHAGPPAERDRAAHPGAGAGRGKGALGPAAARGDAGRVLRSSKPPAAPCRMSASTARRRCRLLSGDGAIKCGPGRSERSHTPDEFVLEEEVLDGARFYTRLIGAYAELRDPAANAAFLATGHGDPPVGQGRASRRAGAPLHGRRGPPPRRPPRPLRRPRLDRPCRDAPWSGPVVRRGPGGDPLGLTPWPPSTPRENGGSSWQTRMSTRRSNPADRLGEAGARLHLGRRATIRS